MCDYSLACFPNRLAVEGEQLVVHRFQTGALGLTSLCPSFKQILFPSSTPAVCVPPGARLLLRDIPGPLQCRLGVREVEEVIFVDTVAWNKLAEVSAEYLKKGRLVALSGSLTQDRWEDEGTGQKRSKIRIQANSVQFLGTGSKDGEVSEEELFPPEPAAEPAPKTQSAKPREKVKR